MDCPANWQAVENALQNTKGILLTPRVAAALDLIRGEVQKLGFEKGLRCLCELERKERSQVNLAARKLAMGSGQLDMPELHALWLVIRCENAGDFLGQMFPPLAKSGPCGGLQPPWTRESALSWMLTELWERRFDTWLKLVALSWCGPFPFYGIDPVPEWM